MLRMAICCGGGFSSSTMAEHLNKQIREKHLEDKIFLEFIPFANLYGDDSAFITSVKRERQDEVDVALLCPHLEYPARDAVKKGLLHIPVFILPMRLYGQIDINGVIEEAEDVLELWNNGTPNVVTFPDEPRSMTAPRNVSHRRWLAQQGK
jgi:PTS system cellobiose-specific IIB component